MTQFRPVPVPGMSSDGGVVQTFRQIDDWLTSQPIQALVSAFGGDLTPTRTASYASGLRDFARKVWDFRNGAERDVARRRTFTDDITELVSHASTALGLREAVPPKRESYDAILILGGLIRGCIVRPRLAAHLVAGRITAGEITALGAFRPLSPPESDLALRLGVDATDEFGALVEGMRRAFGSELLEPPTEAGQYVADAPTRAWRSVTWERAEGGKSHFDMARVVAAPTRRPDAARANTLETYRFWAEQLIGDGVESILLVTNSIYVPYQGCVAIRTLGLDYGLSVETVGVGEDKANLGLDTQSFGTQDYLQEILSSVNAMTTLRSALATADRSTGHPNTSSQEA